MDRNPSNIMHLWTKFLSSGDLSPNEEVTLRQELQTNPQLRQQLLADESLHWMLMSLEDLEKSEDSFVEGVLSSCQAGQEPPALPVDRQRQPSVFDDGGLDAEARHSIVPPPPICQTSPELTTSDQEELALIQLNGHARKPQARSVRRSFWLQPSSLLALSCALLFLIGAGIVASRSLQEDPEVLTRPGNHSHSPKSPRDHLPEQPDSPQPLPHHPLEQGKVYFATLTDSDQADWRTARTSGQRIGDEILELIRGRARLIFDDGAIVDVVGPAKLSLVSGGAMRLDHGNLSARVPASAIGFQVQTPTSRIVDLGTEFDIAVQGSGTTDVVVRQGEVAVAPHGQRNSDSQQWQLVADGLNRATFYERVDLTPQSPIAAVAQGNKGQFHGVISVNGEAMEFESPEAFENVRRRVMSSFIESPDSTFRAWSEFVETFHRESEVKGSLMLNGIEVDFGNLDEVMRLHQRFHDEIKKREKKGGARSSSSSSASSRAFAGSISINGKVKTFSSQDEYEAARREMFGSAATFGAGGLGSKLESPERN